MEVKTYLRIRPVANIGFRELYEISPDQQNLTIKEIMTSQQLNRQATNQSAPQDQSFSFNQIFDQESTQKEVFTGCCQHLVDEVMFRSQKAALISQGETQSGKSYTIFGIENIQQEEFSVDLDDPKDTRGLVMKAAHYIFKKAKQEGKQLTMECQIFDIYLDQIRDLSKGKNNKFNKNQIVFDREKEIEIEENQYGDIVLNHLQSIKINNPKEAANFIEKSMDYQKKLEKDNQAYVSLAHTIFIMNISYGNDISSQLYFIELGAADRKGGKKQKEGFVVQSGLNAFFKHLMDFQYKMSDDEKDLLNFKENKLTFVMKNLFKEYHKVSLITHLYLTESNLQICLKSLEVNERVHNQPINKKMTRKASNFSDDSSDEDDFDLEQMIQNLNKDNFELRNNIETMRRAHKVKLEELQQLLGIPCEIEYLMKNRDTAPQMAFITEQRKCLEKADSLIKNNKEIEKKIDFLTFDLQDLKKDKKHQQENFSQQFIVLNQQLEQLKEEKDKSLMILENKLRMQKVYSQAEFKNLQQHGSKMIKDQTILSNNIQKNNILAKYENIENVEKELDIVKENGYQEGVVKYTKIYKQQLKVQEKERERIKEQYDSSINKKKDQINNLIGAYQKYQDTKSQQLKEAKQELIKLYEVSVKQDQIVQGLRRGDFSGAGQSAKIPKKDLIELPKPDKYPILHTVLKEKADKDFYNNSGTGQGQKTATLKGTQHFQNSIETRQMLTENYKMNQELLQQNTKEMNLEQLKVFIKSMQDEVKKAKQNPLNPDKIKIDRIKELLEERERFKDLYVSESIKNKEFNDIQERQILSSGSKRPMTTVSSQYSMKQSSTGGGFFVTQLRPGNRQLLQSSSSKRLPQFY